MNCPRSTVAFRSSLFEWGMEDYALSKHACAGDGVPTAALVKLLLLKFSPIP